ncbi:hypothetical protein RJT34_22102 [Clitoria ternatea]|uniref:Uncharacterized protein n=1 Tax=Clitoria ternatea TaxID=43366 RepID=A0AAN9IVT8_CLITE
MDRQSHYNCRKLPEYKQMFVKGVAKHGVGLVLIREAVKISASARSRQVSGLVIVMALVLLASASSTVEH